MIEHATFDAYQDAASRTINGTLSNDDRLLDAACGLAEEAGEVLAHIRKHRMQGRALSRAAVVEELGDALWCITMVARGLDVSLGAVADANIAKLRARFPDGFP